MAAAHFGLVIPSSSLPPLLSSVVVATVIKTERAFGDRAGGVLGLAPSTQLLAFVIAFEVLI